MDTLEGELASQWEDKEKQKRKEHCTRDDTENGEGQQVIRVIRNMGCRKGGLGDELGLEA